MFAFYLLNQWRNFSRAAVTFTLLLFLPVVFIVIRVNGCERLVMSGFDFQETDFYAREYVYVGNPELKPEKRRNVIIVFGESLEKKFVAPGVQGGDILTIKMRLNLQILRKGMLSDGRRAPCFPHLRGRIFIICLTFSAMLCLTS